ncbi:hypothetical protein Tcan_12923 [Toxocara canis]|nr:hypothetical protein Tcan_12923 [Toxocara canis]
MMNVPAWIVQVRHEATHAHLPPLKRLREAARWCHEWLWHNHWKKPVDEAMSAEEEKGIALPTLNDRIVALIDDFIRYRMNHPDEGLRPYRPRANGLLDQLEKMVLSNLNDFVDAFLSDGYLIMNENQLRDAAMSEQTDVKGIWHVPATLQLFWQPVFSILNRAKALPELLYQLVVALGASPVTNVRRRQLVGWVDRMLDAFLHSQQLSELDWKRIMRRMLDCRENFTDTHLEAVAGKIVSMTNQKRQHLQQLLSMSPVVAKKSHIKRSASKDQEEGDGVASVKIVADLCTLKKMANSISEVEDETIRASDTWIRCDASSWQEVPLGLTPHQSNDTIMLVIDTETFIPRKRWCP